MPMLKLARRLAKKSTHRQHLHASIVARGGNIVSCGYNHERIHAETMALSKLWPSERVGTTVWSIRVSKSGRLGMAKPCSKCMSFLVASRVKQVFFSNASGEIERLKI